MSSPTKSTAGGGSTASTGTALFWTSEDRIGYGYYAKRPGGRLPTVRQVRQVPARGKDGAPSGQAGTYPLTSR
eukprot:5146237-Prymnesium_polylepis.1